MRSLVSPLLIREQPVTILSSDGAILSADLRVPGSASSVVLFAHGSGSSRHSPRNRSVASRLNEVGLATLLLDLLTPGEEETDARRRVFDIALLSSRLVDTARWASSVGGGAFDHLAFFGASTGSAAALTAASELRGDIEAIVSRGGRPDLVPADRLEQVEAPTLLIVGGDDVEVLDLNRRALADLRCEKRLAVVPGATHLFEERGALGQVADLAAEWLTAHVDVGEVPR